VRIIPEPSVSRIMVDDWLSLVGLVASRPWVRTCLICRRTFEVGGYGKDAEQPRRRSGG
jgi:hypothetical protein